jgi:hypothetical protein
MLGKINKNMIDITDEQRHFSFSAHNYIQVLGDEIAGS